VALAGDLLQDERRIGVVAKRIGLIGEAPSDGAVPVSHIADA
jgi:hypothetical protein